eukprot:COSAG02_NODE_7094_length_3188_cov_138.913241_3_plen_65_part_00
MRRCEGKVVRIHAKSTMTHRPSSRCRWKCSKSKGSTTRDKGKSVKSSNRERRECTLAVSGAADP